MPSRLANAVRRPWWTLAALPLLTLAPKCIVCLAAYLGLATALGLGGPELCGASSDPTRVPVLIASALLVTAGITCLLVRKTTTR